MTENIPPPQTILPPARKRAPGGGRKRLDEGQETVIVKMRVTAAQYEKLKKLPNASAWLRAQIDGQL